MITEVNILLLIVSFHVLIYFTHKIFYNKKQYDKNTENLREINHPKLILNKY